MQYTQHARERMLERGVTEEDVAWAVQSSFVWTNDGTRLHRRWYTATSGRRFGIYVVLDPHADRVVTVWVQTD